MARKLSEDDLVLYEQLAIVQARRNFYAFRKHIHPKLKTGWFIKELSDHLQEFYIDYINGLRPKMAISTPPQFGKSSAVVDFIAWVSGKHPDKKMIFTSFSERLGTRANNALQRMIVSPRYQKVFPDIVLGKTCNNEMIEFNDGEGYFRNTTVGGPITGESISGIGIIDDALKGREAANSETVRNKIWDWFCDDFSTRFSEEAALLIIMTRWHVDDLLSRLMDSLGNELKIINYPAIAEVDEKNRKAGESLFPELKSLDFLMSMKALMPSSSWLSLYQGSPTHQGGELLHGYWFQRYNILPLLEHRVIYADTAMKTKERNDYSVLQCWGKCLAGRIYLIDMIRGKWEAPELESRTIDFWNKHKAMTRQETGQLRAMKIEDKASGTGLIQKIKTLMDPLIPIEAIQREKDKYTRFLDIAGYISSGYVYLPENAPWVSDFIAEAEAFTSDDSHLHDDQLDPMFDAINDLVAVQGEMNIWAQLGKR